MVLAGDLVPAGTVLVTPVLKGSCANFTREGEQAGALQPVFSVSFVMMKMMSLGLQIQGHGRQFGFR